MNKVIKSVLNTINDNGYEAYIVGGFVRDFLLNINSFDIDICTNCLPDKIKELFPLYKEENPYGGVTFEKGKYRFEITTYRRELEYEKRKPIKIEFIDSLEEDLLRRDFTINTICMDKDGSIIDLMNGQRDLNDKKIVCIGDPLKKFAEDPLRMLRAIRFASKLDFYIENETQDAIKKSSKLVSTLSNERVFEELYLTLTNINFMDGLKYYKSLGICDVLGMSFDKVVYTSFPEGMFAQINFSVNYLPKSFYKNVCFIKKILNVRKIENFELFNYGLDMCLIAADILKIDKSLVKQKYRKLPIKSINDIKIDGNKIMEITNILPGKEVSDIIFELKKEILLGNLKNNQKSITKYLMESWKNE